MASPTSNTDVMKHMLKYNHEQHHIPLQLPMLLQAMRTETR
jgi:hypothetical protein